MTRLTRLTALCLTAVISGACGGSSSSPTRPSSPASQTPPLPSLRITLSPSPVRASLVSSTQNETTYRIELTATFAETAGGSGRVTRLTSTVSRSVGGSTTGFLDVQLPFAAFGSTAQAFYQDFALTSSATVTVRVSVTGVDSHGRSFESSMAEVAVEPPVVAPPPTPPTFSSSRIDLYGGTGYRQFLGCFTCNQFDVESVHNQFGLYGSAFSSTSIWNQFSDFGSRFSSNSACNEFATNPPVLVQNNRILAELTLNTFRTAALRDQVVLGWLRTSVCRR